MVRAMVKKLSLNPAEWASTDPLPLVQGLLESDPDFQGRCEEAKDWRVAIKKLHPQELLVRWYLHGVVKPDKKDRHRLVYADGDTETLGRALLAALLRSDIPLNRPIRSALATLFDPKQGDEPHAEREIVFKFRKSGNRRDYIHNIQICDDIASVLNRGGQVKAAIMDITEKFEIGSREALRIWGQNKEIYERLGWLKPQEKRKCK